MSVHVRFESDKDTKEAVYNLVQLVSKNGRIKKGSNEVTKAAERGSALFIVLAEDINPPELLAHVPLICDEKNIPYGYVESQEFLAKEAGMPAGTRTASIAIMEVGQGAQEKFEEVKSLIAKIRA